MTEEARKQRDVTTVRFERDVDIDSLLEASNALHNRLTGTWVASINSQAVSSAAKANN